MSIPSEDPCIEAFRKRYHHLHPLVFCRSLEKAKNAMDLFEILESVPRKLPFSWDEKKRVWTKDQDILAQKKLKNIRKK
jgi:hypothetical protein